MRHDSDGVLLKDYFLSRLVHELCITGGYISSYNWI